MARGEEATGEGEEVVVVVVVGVVGVVLGVDCWSLRQMPVLEFNRKTEGGGPAVPESACPGS